MKYWITKYALSSGIFILKGGELIDAGYLHKMEPETHTQHFYGPREYHTTREAAVAKAKEMAKLKIKSLQKQIAKLENLTFEDAP